MKTIQVAYYKEGEHWVAQALNVEVSTFGRTLAEAKVAIVEALELYFEGARPESPNCYAAGTFTCSTETASIAGRIRRNL